MHIRNAQAAVFFLCSPHRLVVNPSEFSGLAIDLDT